MIDNAHPIALYLTDNWFIYPWLTKHQQQVVLSFAERFCDETEFWFTPSIVPSEELAWLVAANAALVGGAQATNCFAGVRWVYLVGDDAFDGELSGDARGHSTVRINAFDLVEESQERISGQQIAIHEFAHVLDALFGITDSTPALRDALELHLENRRNGIEDIIPDVVFETMVEQNTREEFFSYVSEIFFTDPHGILNFYPPLYNDLVAIYGLNLAKQLPDLNAEAINTK